jgi:hypothetical protein
VACFFAEKPRENSYMLRNTETPANQANGESLLAQLAEVAR